MILLFELLTNIILIIYIYYGLLQSNNVYYVFWGMILICVFSVTLMIVLLQLLKKYIECNINKTLINSLKPVSKIKWVQNLIYILLAMSIALTEGVLDGENIIASFFFYLGILYIPFLLIGLITSLFFAKKIFVDKDILNTIFSWLFTIPPGVDLIFFFLLEVSYGEL